MTDHPWAGAAYVGTSPPRAPAAHAAPGEEQWVAEDTGAAGGPAGDGQVIDHPPRSLPDRLGDAQATRTMPASPAPVHLGVVTGVVGEVPVEVARPRPRSSAALMPSRVRLERRAATKGWRGGVRRASFGLISPRAGAEEVEEAQDRRAMNTQWSRGKTVVVANPKGGAGKSPTC